jgi:hypothetical protein
VLKSLKFPFDEAIQLANMVRPIASAWLLACLPRQTVPKPIRSIWLRSASAKVRAARSVENAKAALRGEPLPVSDVAVAPRNVPANQAIH